MIWGDFLHIFYKQWKVLQFDFLSSFYFWVSLVSPFPLDYQFLLFLVLLPLLFGCFSLLLCSFSKTYQILVRSHRNSSKCHQEHYSHRSKSEVLCFSSNYKEKFYTRCVWKWEICFLHTVFASRLKIENEYQKISEAKYIYITPKHIFIFILWLMIWKISLPFWIYFLWPILLIRMCLNWGYAVYIWNSS